MIAGVVCQVGIDLHVGDFKTLGTFIACIIIAIRDLNKDRVENKDVIEELDQMKFSERKDGKKDNGSEDLESEEKDEEAEDLEGGD